MNAMEIQAKAGYADSPMMARPMTLRERLTAERDRLQERVNELSGLLEKLNANPNVADIVDEVFKIVR